MSHEILKRNTTKKKEGGGKLWNVVNVAALAGWGYLLHQVVTGRNAKWTPEDLNRIVQKTLILEGVCIAEVVQMALSGSGNVPLGISLHYTRIFVACIVWPVLLRQGYQNIVVAILLAWAVTEVCRYPCYICKLANIKVRLPLTFVSTINIYVDFICIIFVTLYRTAFLLDFIYHSSRKRLFFVSPVCSGFVLQCAQIRNSDFDVSCGCWR